MFVVHASSECVSLGVCAGFLKIVFFCVFFLLLFVFRFQLKMCVSHCELGKKSSRKKPDFKRAVRCLLIRFSFALVVMLLFYFFALFYSGCN